MGIQRGALILLSISVIACGGGADSPTAPSSTPARVTISGAIAETLTGAAVGTFSQTVDRLPAMVTVSAPGYVTRQTLVGSASPTVDLIKDAAPFDMSFYRQLVRNGFESTALQPVRVLAGSPAIYLQSAGLSPSNVAALEAAARAIVPAMTGNRLAVTAFETGADARALAPGWIVAELVNDDAKTCGLAEIGAPAGHVWLNVVPRCGDGRQTIDPGVFAHEIGHALGFYHVEASNTLMKANVRRQPVASDGERYHAAIAYARRTGNRDPDIDDPTSAPLHLAAPNIIVID